MLKKKVIVITGGAGLIGQAFIKAVIEQNGIAIIADIHEKVGKELKINLSQEFNTTNVEFLKVDITSKHSLNKCIKYLNRKYQRIDALVNNAYPRNSNYGKHFFDVDYRDFVENLGLNLGGYFLTSQQFAKYFEKQGYGNIVNISSVYGIIAPKFEIYHNTEMTMPVEYAVIKSGLIHLTKYMAKYFKGKNIRINSISPGGILDNQPKDFLKQYKQQCLTKGILDPNDISGTLIFLLSDVSSFLSGQNIVVDDGFCL